LYGNIFLKLRGKPWKKWKLYLKNKNILDLNLIGELVL